jgi:hypothetical protein
MKIAQGAGNNRQTLNYRSFPRCVKPNSYAVTDVAKFSSGSYSRGGCARCRLAAQGVTVNKSIGRGERDSSNRDLSRSCSCDRFAASNAIIAFSDCLLAPIPVYLRQEGRGCHWFEDDEAGLRV